MIVAKNAINKKFPQYSDKKFLFKKFFAIFKNERGIKEKVLYFRHECCWNEIVAIFKATEQLSG